MPWRRFPSTRSSASAGFRVILQPRRVELIQVRQHIVLEALASLLECLGYLSHPLGDVLCRPMVSTVWAGGYIPAAPGLEASQPAGAGARYTVGDSHAVCNRAPGGFIPPVLGARNAGPARWPGGNRRSGNNATRRSGQVRSAHGGEHHRKKGLRGRQFRAGIPILPLRQAPGATRAARCWMES